MTKCYLADLEVPSYQIKNYSWNKEYWISCIFELSNGLLLGLANGSI